MTNGKEITIDSSMSYTTTIYDKEKCSCDNIVLEAHHTLYYGYVPDTDNINFNIINVTLDVIYGKLTPQSCTEEVLITRKSSFVFRETIFSRKNSGAPGYIKGSNLLVGTAIQSLNGNYIKKYYPGF